MSGARQLIGVCAVVICALAGAIRAPVYATTTPVAGWLHGWPMYGHDPQRTFLSPDTAPLHPQLQSQHKGSGILLNAEGAAIGFYPAGRKRVLGALSPAGKVRVVHASIPARERPVGIRRDGGIIEMGDDGTAQAISATGKRLWKNSELGLAKGAMPSVMGDGRVFISAVGHPENATSGLYVLSGAGKVAKHMLRAIPVFGTASGTDGYVYVLVYDPGSGESFLVGFSPVLKEVWRYKLASSLETSGECVCVMALSRGVVVVDGRQLIALEERGTVAWRFDDGKMIQGLAQRPDGSVVLADSASLSAVSSAGKKLFETDIKAVHTSGANEVLGRPSLAVDGAGTVYIGSSDGEVLVVDAHGAVVSRLPAGGYRFGFVPTVLLGPGGRLYVSGNDGVVRIYAGAPRARAHGGPVLTFRHAGQQTA